MLFVISREVSTLTSTILLTSRLVSQDNETGIVSIGLTDTKITGFVLPFADNVVANNLGCVFPFGIVYKIGLRNVFPDD